MSFTFVYAGAGCGKTTWIINNIVKLVGNFKKTNDKKILVITYTNSCVEELKNRLQCELENFSDFVDVFTFHSLCHKYTDLDGVFSENTNLHLLLSYCGEGYEASFEEFYSYYLCHTPISIDEYVNNLNEYYKEAKLLDAIENIRLEDFITVDGKLRKTSPSYIKNKDQWMETKNQLTGYFDFLKKQHNLVYFKRCLLVEEVRKYLKIYTYHHMILNILDNLWEFLRAIYANYEHVFIDEVQDLSHIQFQIIEALSEELVYHPNHSIKIVGDIHQSIYSFQGANGDNFYKLIDKIKNIPQLNYKEEILNKTYRFGGEILDFVNKNFHTHSSDLDHGNMFVYPLCKDKNQLLEQIYNAITNTMELSQGSILVLFQRRSSLTMALEEKFTSVKITQKISYQDPMLCTFFSLISYIVTDCDEHLINFLLGSMFIIPEPEFYHFVEKNRHNIFEGLKTCYGSGLEFLLLEKLRSVKTTEEFLYLFSGSIFHQVAYGSYGNNINILLTELEKIKSIPILDLLYLDGFDLWFEKDGMINFSTVHNSKGMEADHVFIVDANREPTNQSITLFNNCPFYNFFTKEEPNYEEFNNLLYVSITRAKKTLHIFGQGTKISENSLYSMLK